MTSTQFGLITTKESGYEMWKVARTKFDGNMTSSSAALISLRIFIRPQKQPMHEPFIDEDDEMAEVEDDPLAKLMTKLLRYMDIIIVDQGRSSMYGFVKPQTIQPSSNTIETKQNYLQTWMTESNRDCNKQLDSWECGYYVISWIKTIIRVAIIDEWTEHFKSTCPISEDPIKKIKQEWTTYLLQRWT
ncbi:hypothetical protein LR48_Vigan07g210000 [Vigna angularis]|uniref:Ubiquitin-like protease family profile domain-containing protein n=1 Tax=Phaseolus angularis TaxID=3914 RepID=A0A0L9V0B4_PHAAN|nr:hypothetical protein LR48_Vigan07g210000 [Vigna angularis]